MNKPITLIKKEIETVEFELVLNPTAPKGSIGSLPCLYINGEPHIIYDVDVIDVIRTIATANNMIYVKKGVAGNWCEEQIKETCTKYELELGLTP